MVKSIGEIQHCTQRSSEVKELRHRQEARCWLSALARTLGSLRASCTCEAAHARAGSSACSPRPPWRPRKPAAEQRSDLTRLTLRLVCTGSAKLTCPVQSF